MSKQEIRQFIDEYRELWITTSRTIWNNPELGHMEFEAMKLLTSILEQFDFVVERGTAGLPTAFKAEYHSHKPGPTIAYLAEYDALPGIGHACGHNIIGVMSLAAAISLKKTVQQFGGKVLLFGTPAEETSGGKVSMTEQGYFNNIDVAMMAHPFHSHERSGTSMALEALQFDFYGRPAHAASRPQDGINALDGVIQTFVAINALRQHLTSDVRIHGVITIGGEAANIVPKHAQAQFYVRTATKDTLISAVEKVKKCAQAAALATGSELEISNYELGYDNLITNNSLSNLFTDNLIDLGVKAEEIKNGLDHGSLDMGNVSQVTPSIHPYIQVPDSPYGCHTLEFRDAVGSDKGMEALLLGAKALAWTGYDLLTEPDRLATIREEFNTTFGHPNEQKETCNS